MQEQGSSATGNFLLAFLAGAAVGGLVVALTTPKRGEDLRAELKGLGGRLKERTEGAYEDLGASFDEARQRAGKAMTDLKGGVAEAADDMRG